MEDLNQIREALNTLDDQIIALIEERVALADQVAENKKEGGRPIYQPEREKEIIDRLTDKVNPETKSIVAPVWDAIIRHSKTLQYAKRFNYLVQQPDGDMLRKSFENVEAITQGKSPVIQIGYDKPQAVNYFLKIMDEAGFYPLELKITDCTCTCLLGILEEDGVTEAKFVQTLFQLCNEFTNVRMMGWV